jgi:hypothetical protein
MGVFHSQTNVYQQMRAPRFDWIDVISFIAIFLSLALAIYGGFWLHGQ